MNNSLPEHSLWNRLLSRNSAPDDLGFISRTWLLGLLLIGGSSGSWGQCFQPTTVALNKPAISVGDFPYSIAGGDFNGDGKPDLVTANSRASDVSVVLGDGNGNFGTATNFTVGSAPFSVAVGDFNADGKPDLVTANFGSNDVSILLNNGSGSFGPATHISVGERPSFVVVGNLNGDGKLDLVVANRNSVNVSVLLNNGSGGFGAATNFETYSEPVSIVVGNFTADGHPDLIVACNRSGALVLLLGNGSGVFSPPINMGVGDLSAVSALAAGDFNGDAKLDLAATSETGGILTLLGVGNGSFQSGVYFNYDDSNSFRSVVVGDFNGDTKLDMAAPNQNTDDVWVWLGDGTGKFGLLGFTPSRFSVGDGPTSIATGDFNADGKPDLATASGRSNNISALLGFGNGRFDVGADSPRFATPGDFNGDGKPDLAVANAISRNVSVLLANGSGGFGATIHYLVGSGPTSVAVGDLNGDSKLDLVTANTNAGTISVLLGNGQGGFGTATNFTVGTSPRSVTLSDFNGDGKLDLATTNLDSDNISVLLGNGNGGFGAATNFAAGDGVISIAVGDFNGDNKLDLVTANFGSANVSVLLGNGSGGFGAATNFVVGGAPESVAVGDLNGDGKPDLAVANLTTISVLLGTGSGSFGAATNFPTNLLTGRSSGVAIGDFNSDGKLDMTSANRTESKVSVLLGNGSGGFDTATNIVVGSAPYSVAVSDFNGDGKPDLVTANSGSDNVSVLYNCTTEDPDNTAPTVANTIPPQSATVGQGFTLSLANTFTDAQTPNALFLSESGLPAGLTISGNTISGVPSVSGVSSVTVIATDPGDLSVGTTFILTVNPTSTPGNQTGFAIADVTTVSCATISTGERKLMFTPQYAGLTGQPVSFSVVNELSATTSPGPYSLRIYTDNPVITLKARQTGSAGEASFTYNWLAACGPSSPPPSSDFSITGVTTVNCEVVTSSERRITFSPHYTGITGQPVTFSVVNELSATTSPGPYSLRIYTDNPVITLKARQTGSAGEASFTYNWLAACSSPARLGVDESLTDLRVRVLGNPVQNKELKVLVQGAQGQRVRLQVIDQRGYMVTERIIGQAGAEEEQVLPLENQLPGLLILRISTDRQQQTIKVVNL